MQFKIKHLCVLMTVSGALAFLWSVHPLLGTAAFSLLCFFVLFHDFVVVPNRHIHRSAGSVRRSVGCGWLWVASVTVICSGLLILIMKLIEKLISMLP